MREFKIVFFSYFVFLAIAGEFIPAAVLILLFLCVCLHCAVEFYMKPKSIEDFTKLQNELDELKSEVSALKIHHGIVNLK